MDMMKWLEPSIAKKIDDITEVCDNAAESMDNRFREECSALMRELPEIQESLLMLTDLYFNRQTVIETAYRNGFSDGLFIVKKIGFGEANPNP